MIAQLLVAVALTFTPVQGKGPPPPSTPQCETREAIVGSLSAGTVLAREISGAAAQDVSNRLGGEGAQIDLILVFTNPQYPNFVWLVGFQQNCVAGEGIISRVDYERLLAEAQL